MAVIPTPTYRADYQNSKQLGSLEKFTRGSEASVVDYLGRRRTSALNQPRFDFDPLTLESRGILMENEAVNMVTNSEFPNGLADAPAASGMVTPVPMAGFQAGLALGYDGVTANRAYKTCAVLPNTTYTVSAFVQMDDGGAPIFGDPVNPYSSLNDFVITVGGYNVTPSRVDDFGDGLYRVSQPLLMASSGVGSNAGIQKIATNSSRTLKMSGLQVERADDVSSYVFSGSSTGSRARSIIGVTGEAFSKNLNMQEGTILFEGLIGRLGQLTNSEIAMCMLNANANDQLLIYRGNVGGFGVGARVNGVLVASYVWSDTVALNSRVCIALSFKAGRWSLGYNGTSRDFSTSTSVPSVDRLHIGYPLGGWLGWCGHVLSWEAHCRALSLAELAEITK